MFRYFLLPLAAAALATTSLVATNTIQLNDGLVPLLQDPQWTDGDYEGSQSLICVWHASKAKTVIKACQELGFEITDSTALGNGVVCTWKGKLDRKKLDALTKNPAVRYVEPNLVRGIDLESATDSLLVRNPAGPKPQLDSDELLPGITPNDPFMGRLYGMLNIRGQRLAAGPHHRRRRGRHRHRRRLRP